MTDAPRTPVFDANGWCHQMEDAPRDADANLDLWHKKGFRVTEAEFVPRLFGWVGRDSFYDAMNITAWRYPPAPPVGE